MMTKIRFCHDGDVPELHWYLETSGGERIYETGHGAWDEAKAYLAAHNLSITRFVIEFRSHTEEIDMRDADGMFFSYGAGGSPSQQHTDTFYVIGKVINDKVLVYRWTVPEIIVHSQETRDLDLSDRRLLLWKNTSPSLAQAS